MDLYFVNIVLLSHKRCSIIFVLLCLLFGAERHFCLPNVSNATPNWRLVWNEEFDGPSINKTRWSYQVTCQPKNQELQCYTDRAENAYIEHGKLIIHVKPETYKSKKFTSSRLYSQCDPTGSFLHGKFEMRARLPKGKHLWPAFWMIPADNAYGTWSRSGEIDIFEYRGQQSSKISSALHYGNPHKSSGTGPVQFDGVDFSKDFHNFTLIWTSSSMTFLMDGKSYWSVNTQKHWGSPYTKAGQPWDQRFHLILNVAVGGNFFNGYGELTDADVRAWSKPTLEVDYIRVYQDTNENNVPPITGLPAACEKSSTGLQVGLGVGIPVACIAIVGVGSYLYLKKRRRNQQSKAAPSPLTTFSEEPSIDAPSSRT